MHASHGLDPISRAFRKLGGRDLAVDILSRSVLPSLPALAQAQHLARIDGRRFRLDLPPLLMLAWR